MMANMMPRITAVAEAYPELKSDTSFLNIQNELVSIENQVADRRKCTMQQQQTSTKQYR